MADFLKGSQGDPPAPPDPASPGALPPAEAGLDDSPFSVRSSTTYVPARRPPQGAHRAPLALLGLILPAGLLLGWLAGRAPKAQKPTAAKSPVAEAVEPVAQPSLAAPRVEPTAPTAADAKGVRSSWTTVENAEQVSRRTGKPVLLAFNADWSPACRGMKVEVFDDASLGEVVRRAVVPVSIVDRARENGNNSPEVESILQNYSIESFPTLVIYMPGTGRAMQMRGYVSANGTARWIQDAAEAVR